MKCKQSPLAGVNNNVNLIPGLQIDWKDLESGVLSTIYNIRLFVSEGYQF